MLDTGIDVREVVNLVFAKPVYSYTKFWQMIGRGTRLLEPAKLKPWCTEKDMFLVLDCWDNFEYFKLQPKGKELKPQLPLPVRLVGLRLDKIEKALALEQSDIAQKEIDILCRQIRELPGSSVVIIEAAPALDQISDKNFWTRLTPQKLEFLRSRIKPLFRVVSQVDFKAMRFEKDVLDISLALLSGEKIRFDTLKDGLVEQIGELPLSVHIVARQAALIQSAQRNTYWESCTDEVLDELSEETGAPDEIPRAAKSRAGSGTVRSHRYASPKGVCGIRPPTRKPSTSPDTGKWSRPWCWNSPAPIPFCKKSKEGMRSRGQR